MFHGGSVFELGGVGSQEGIITTSNGAGEGAFGNGFSGQLEGGDIVSVAVGLGATGDGERTAKIVEEGGDVERGVGVISVF